VNVTKTCSEHALNSELFSRLLEGKKDEIY
jgi:hypothetical protein